MSKVICDKCGDDIFTGDKYIKLSQNKYIKLSQNERQPKMPDKLADAVMHQSCLMDMINTKYKFTADDVFSNEVMKIHTPDAGLKFVREINKD